jgi:hypothetical protein
VAPMLQGTCSLTYATSPRQLQTEVCDAVANPRISDCQPSQQPESQINLAQRRG